MFHTMSKALKSLANPERGNPSPLMLAGEGILNKRWIGGGSTRGRAARLRSVCRQAITQSGGQAATADGTQGRRRETIQM